MRINEIFGPTIQGEGKTAGKIVMFLRLSGCNLHCSWCDTPYTWNWIGTKFDHPQKFDRASETFEMTDEQIITKLKSLGTVKSLVISGGEPLLQQQALISLMKKLKGWWIEIETNGTIAPCEELLGLVSQINCSPKLANSNNPLKQRVKEEAMKVLASSKKVNFKFVVSSEKDEKEIGDFIFDFCLQQVYLMPLGMTVAELDVSRQRTQDLAKKMGVRYSERLHVTQLGGGRGL